MNTRDLKKHRNDVIRILSEMPLVPCNIPDGVRLDVSEFLRELDISNQDIHNMGISEINVDDIQQRLEELYL